MHHCGIHRIEHAVPMLTTARSGCNDLHSPQLGETNARRRDLLPESLSASVRVLSKGTLLCEFPI